jgi:hypothetical protein
MATTMEHSAIVLSSEESGEEDNGFMADLGEDRPPSDDDYQSSVTLSSSEEDEQEPEINGQNKTAKGVICVC